MKSTARLKTSNAMIRLVRPTELNTSDLIYPIFIREDGKTQPIPSMNGQNYLSLDDAVDICHQAVKVGIPAVMVFGVLKTKDSDATIALDENGFHSQIFRKLKKELGYSLVLISNVCLCDFTKDESCVYSKDGQVLNKKTAEMLGKIAVVHAKAGADVIAPAAMCDGQVLHIRQALDDSGFDNTAIMSYIKTDSSLFQPFFEAMTNSKDARHGVDSSKFRCDVLNEKSFMQKVALDVDEGADMIIVKPALTNLDLVLRVKQKYPELPVAAYQVSGEYAMTKLVSQYCHIRESALILETLKSIKRAGADMALTYHAIEAANLIKKSIST
jgi:porphobilinogen synthase